MAAKLMMQSVAAYSSHEYMATLPLGRPYLKLTYT